ncbi:MAG: sn-glycerol-3-phosphate ABC transporter ATP-binding protein UgpC [Rhodobacteraceae bacterium]|nr:sn-glycerol-3-phosphate ABC transporter ATP-binding protein UgpC [Paracoccaceae bacterium]
MATLKLKDFRKSFGKVEVIKGVDLEIGHGEFVVFVGPSGCGKSTLLRMISGLEDITSGTLEIDGRVMNDLPPKDREVAMVFQTYAIFPHMTVRENMAFGLTIARASKQEKQQKVAEAARILQMEHLLDRHPSQLSGGQRQRVAIGRAIVRNPKVFLFDEPLSNLDAALRMDMRMEIGKLHEQLDATMVYVTHDQVEAMTLADKIVVLKDGRVMQVGTPMDLYHDPGNLFVAGFLGAPSMNFLQVDVQTVEGDDAKVGNAALKPINVAHKDRLNGSGKAILGVRPQHVEAAAPGEGMLLGTVEFAERLGSETVVDMVLKDDSKFIAAFNEDKVFEPGQTVDLVFDPAQAHLFAPSDEVETVH